MTLFIIENDTSSVGWKTITVLVVILDSNDIRLYGLLNPRGIVIRRKGMIHKNVVSLLGILFIILMSIISTPVKAAVILILNIQ